MWRTDSFEKTLMLGKIEGRRRRGWWGWDSWMASLTQWTWVWASSGSWWWTGKLGVLQSTGSQRSGHDWATKQNWYMSFKSLFPQHGFQLIIYLFLFIHGIGLPWWLKSKESSCNAGDLGSIPGSEDPLEEGMATHSSFLAWRIPWTEEPGSYSP